MRLFLTGRDVAKADAVAEENVAAGGEDRPRPCQALTLTLALPDAFVLYRDEAVRKRRRTAEGQRAVRFAPDAVASADAYGTSAWDEQAGVSARMRPVHLVTAAFVKTGAESGRRRLG